MKNWLKNGVIRESYRMHHSVAEVETENGTDLWWSQLIVIKQNKYASEEFGFILLVIGL